MTEHSTKIVADADEPRPSRAVVYMPEDFERASGPFVTASSLRDYQSPTGPVPHVTMLHGPFPGNPDERNAVQPEAYEDGDAAC